MGTVLYLRNENVAYIGNRKRQRMPESRIKKGNSVLEISLNRLNGWKRNIIAVNFEKARVLLESVKRILMTETCYMITMKHWRFTFQGLSEKKYLPQKNLHFRFFSCCIWKFSWKTEICMQCFHFFLKDKFPDGCGLWDAKTGMMAMLLWWAVHLVSNNMFIIFYTF